MPKSKKELRELIAIRNKGVFAFPTKHDRAMFLHEITNAGKRRVDYAFSTLPRKRKR